jgi:hypothetical protein
MYRLYSNTPECLTVHFDLRYADAEERLRREQDAWCGFAHFEKLTAESSVLIVQPGGARRLMS